MKLVIGHLYPRLMNLYGDRGNVLCLAQRCRWRGIEAEVREIGPGELIDPQGFDIFFMGGGQDKEQRMVAQDLAQNKGQALRRAVESGVVALTVCGGYQLFGRYYRPAEGPELPGIGIFDAWTVHKTGRPWRLIGNVVVEQEGQTLVGFENHGGRTYLGPGARPLGRVVVGYGNNAEDGTEGAVCKNAFGTYIHGSFLPKNPDFADHMIALAMARRYGDVALPPLDDAIEKAAHDSAVRLAVAEAPLRVRLRRLLPWARI